MTARGRPALLVLALSAAGCPRPSPAPPVAPSDSGVAPSLVPVKTATAAAANQKGEMMHMGQRFRECHVYVDGVPVGALAWGELPPNVTTIWHQIADGRKYRRYGLYSYLSGLGVDMKKLKEVHLYGGRTRACILSGGEVRRFKDEIQIAFTQSKRGQPQIYWPKGVKINDSIDKITRMAVYVDKKPPVWDPQEYVLRLDGEMLENGEIPYATGEIRSGARIYVDGVLATILKRNKLEATKSSSIAEKNPAVPLLAHLASLGRKVASLKSADIVDDEDYVGHVDKKDLSALAFSLIDNSGGEVLVHPLEKRATAILLYEKKPPPDFSKR